MSTNPKVSQEILVQKILLIRNQKVMIDSDLAILYGTTTKRLNEQVKRNKNRFPNNFMFQLTKEEKNEVVANCDHLKNLKFSSKLPFVFTEQGTMMLANVIKSDKAISMSILIIETFIRLRTLLSSDMQLSVEIENIKKKLSNHDKNLELVFSYLEELETKKAEPRKRIGYKS